MSQRKDDERVGRSGSPAEQRTETDRSTGQQHDDLRDGRSYEDRHHTQDRQLTDDERLELFRQTFFREVLPNPPRINGFHICWLTTTNPNDTIQARMRLGYVPVLPGEAPGWSHAIAKTGDHAGLIMVNEMVAFKIPTHLYQAFMKHAHHDAPMEEQRKLTATVDNIKAEAEKVRAQIIEEEGTAELRKFVRPPTQFEDGAA